MSIATTDAINRAVTWRDYLELCKPRVVLLMLLTTLVGMYLATTHWIPLDLVGLSLLGIGCCAGSAAAINHVVDRRIDALMARTRKRPVAHGRMTEKQAIYFASILGLFGLWVLMTFVNLLTAIFTFLTLMGYAGIYTGYLKRATPQNIVIGGLAGAAPPLLGWTAVTGYFDPHALLLVLIIFVWTPPHFWALAIYRLDEYKKAEIPMLPVTHGVWFTKLYVVLYTVLLLISSLLPVVIGMSGMIYGVIAFGLGARFLWWSVKLYCSEQATVAIRTFRFSIVYLMLIFVGLLFDHYW